MNFLTAIPLLIPALTLSVNDYLLKQLTRLREGMSCSDYVSVVAEFFHRSTAGASADVSQELDMAFHALIIFFDRMPQIGWLYSRFSHE
jgi:hypothetical protein